ncbi:hypothetical protein [Sorangium sp. So ce542]|uniref:hypothetical protein n=1 Tax=Sorangium sp. So ce542 TaxID=3133316 RepID=UPI003F634ED2
MKRTNVFCRVLLIATILTLASSASANTVNVAQCHYKSNTPVRSGNRIVGSARYWCDHGQNPLNNKRNLHVSISEWDYYKGWVSRARANNDGGFSTGVTVNVSTGCKFGRWRVVSQVYVHNVFGGRWLPASYSAEFSANC